jgi:hypothetical protein
MISTDFETRQLLGREPGSAGTRHATRSAHAVGGGFVLHAPCACPGARPHRLSAEAPLAHRETAGGIEMTKIAAERPKARGAPKPPSPGAFLRSPAVATALLGAIITAFVWFVGPWGPR